MLENIRIVNFKCLQNVEVPLRPLTVLVGPNDTGKSAFLSALRFFHPVQGLSKYDYWRGDQSARVLIKGNFDSDKQIIYDTKSGKNLATIRPNVPNPFVPISFYWLPSDGIQMLSSGYRDEGDPPLIEENGSNIPALLDHLLRRDRKRYDEFVSTMRDLVSGLEQVEIATPDPSNRRIDFIIENGFRIPADQTSVGLRLMLFFVAMAYHPKPPKLILLEEPENGVHPKRLEDVVRLLREITQGKHGGHAAQVIHTTHSPHLLDYIKPDEDQVLVFKRNEDGSRTADPADTKRLENFLDEFMLGEVWYNEGEEGLVKKK